MDSRDARYELRKSHNLENERGVLPFETCFSSVETDSLAVARFAQASWAPTSSAKRLQERRLQASSGKEVAGLCPCLPCHLLQLLRVILEMLINKAGDEEIGMVIARLQAQIQFHVGIAAGSLKVFRQQLAIRIEIVGLALIHQ